MPPMFTIEAWIKLDTISPPPTGLVMPIFGKFTSENLDDPNDRAYKVGIAASTNILRIYVNSLFYDSDFPFVLLPEWHYVAVSYIKIHKKKTKLIVFIDGV